MNIRFDPQLVFENNAVKGSGATYLLQSILEPNAKAGPLKIETVGPISLLPNGQKCGLRFEANGTVLIALGMRDYGHGYASSYFANILVARLGSAFERIRVYYAGGVPAVRCTPKHAPHIQSRDNVCVATAEIGDLIETLCDQAVEKGRRLLAASIGVQPSDIDFEASSGRFFVVDSDRYGDASEIARRTGNAEHGRPSCRRGPRADTSPGAVALRQMRRDEQFSPDGTKMATVVTAPAPPSLAALKSKQQVARYAADGAVVSATLQIPGESVRKSLETGTDSLLRHALELLLTHRGNPSVEVDRVLADDPHSVFGHCLRAALVVCADADAARSTLAASVAAIEAARPDMDDPARRHAAAARAWLEADPALAVERYGAIVIDWPRDILALVVAHALDFRLGRRRMMRDRIAQVLPEWKAAASGYASVLAMYAFGLEENGQYRRAEKAARRALALDPRHPGAIHVVAHVMEMQGRAREGLEFLAATEPAWVEGTGFSVHLAWHRALFHLDTDNPNSALAVYDAQIANTRGSDMSVLADASALLWLLQLRNIRLGERWRSLADRWETQTLDGARPFYVVHAMMAFAAAGRAAAATRVLKALPHADTSGASPSLPEEALAPPLCEALLAFACGDYTACVEWLIRVHHIAHRCGGSLAQCDLIHLTFTEAALRASKARLARALVAERAAQKPASRFNRLLQQRLRMMVPAIA